jgi:hypothetical protein
MANIRKQFNFRNGVQVDDDSLVVSPTGLVGIGTTIPTEALDVRGIAKVVGLVTASEIYTSSLTAENATITTLSLGNSIIGGGVSIRSGIITSSGSGVVTYYGDGGRLSNLPTSQWLDVDVGLGFTSVYSQGFVGISTNDPRYPLQIGGFNNISAFVNGVGIGSEGNIVATGIVTAGQFSGIGSNLTLLDASNIGLGTISNDRIPVLLNSKLPSNIDVSGIITATGGFIGTVYGQLVGNVTGNVVGNLTGIATFARDLVGTPNITVGVITASIVNVSNILSTVNIQSTGIVTAQTISVGTGGTSFFTSSSGRLGIGSASPTKDIQILKSGLSEIEVVGSDRAQITIGQRQTSGIGVGNSTAVIRFGNFARSLDIINGDIGNFNYYLHGAQPVAGITTGSFNWIYGQSNLELMTLTYGGRLGLGNTNPDNTLHVVGTSTVTGNSWFGGNVEISGNLSVNGSLSGNIFALQAQQVYATSGVSTFYDALIGNDLIALGAVGIGTTVPKVEFDAYNKSALFGTIGIGTTSVGDTTFRVDGRTLLSNLSIGNTSVIDDTLSVYDGVALFNEVYISGINSTTLSLDSSCSVGIGTSIPRSSVDFADAGKTSSNGAYSYILPPKLTNAQRAGLSTVAGAFIFNVDALKFQGYTGVAWTDFH